MVKFKARYNETLHQLWKATLYMDGDASLTDKERWQPEYIKLLKKINSMVVECALLGTPMTEDEILNGFREVIP